MDFRDLVTLAVICDKYDCAHVVSSYHHAWLQPHSATALDLGHEDWLLIAVVFNFLIDLWNYVPIW